jgi:hypothetical protein
MGDELGLVGYQFNWALSTFYIVYLMFEVPSNIVLKVSSQSSFRVGLLAPIPTLHKVLSANH